MPSGTNKHYEGGLGPAFQAMLYRIDERARLEAERGIRAWLLAPDIPTYQALINGEAVPAGELRADVVKRYGRRRTQGMVRER